MLFETPPGPHLPAGRRVSSLMRDVLLALVPYAIVHVLLLGPGLLLQLAIAVPTALGCEALAMRIRKRPPQPALGDLSVLVTAALLAASLPPLLPWWLTAFATALAVLLGKQVYGGLGQNPFNPAMVGYAALLVSFPVEMTRWPVPVAPGSGEWTTLAGLSLQAFLSGSSAFTPAWDGWTGATALDALRTELGMRFTMQEITSGPAFGTLGGTGWEWLGAAALLGGTVLLVRGVIRWQIPVSMLLAMTLLATSAHALDAGRHAGALFHLFSGATMLGAFFIATDPVSAATSDRGRLWFGAGIGALTWIIRTYGGYPDGIAFAVLLMNLSVPLLDRWTVPRIYGQAGS
jgi:electron transport complex protein RnfD